MKINGRESTVKVSAAVRSSDTFRWSELKHELRRYFDEPERREVTKIIKTLERGRSYLTKCVTITCF